ncbi:N-(5'-phosphoribosyl)anthranilate isomerase [Gammaproteobacteria bacterium]
MVASELRSGGVKLRTRIKVCGITCPEHALIAADCGVDAIGLVFYPRSPRVVDLETASKIVEVLPPFMVSIALFVNPTFGEVQKVTSQIYVNLLQFHGQESPEFCNSFGLPYLKAVPMRAGMDLEQIFQKYKESRGLLVDTYQPHTHGGTGVTFDWTQIQKKRSFPLILAGGLTQENVGQAIQEVHPYAVDVSSGVESQKGIKNPEKIKEFVWVVRKSDI